MRSRSETPTDPIGSPTRCPVPGCRGLAYGAPACPVHDRRLAAARQEALAALSTYLDGVHERERVDELLRVAAEMDGDGDRRVA